MSGSARRELAAIATTLALGALAAAAACSNDSPQAGSPTDAATDANVADAGGDAADASLADAGPMLPPGCFAGVPTTPLDFLNACTSSAYVLFDNCARLGYCDGGALPDRVPPPPPDAGVSSDGSADASDAG
jgi:hypothetical protein